MKYYEKLVKLGCFTRNDICLMLGNDAAAHSLLYDYLKKGLIERVRRDLYVVISLETKQPVKNRYVIASNITEDSYITHHSAFEYYGCANQVFYEVYTSGSKKYNEFEYDSITYKYMTPHISKGVITDNIGTRVTDMERTVLDGICDFEKVGGLEELLKCLEFVPSVNEEKLLEYLKEYDNKYLYQKTGYILENFKGMLNISNSFFEECLRNIPSEKRYLYKTSYKEDLELNKKWNLYVPKDPFGTWDTKFE